VSTENGLKVEWLQDEFFIVLNLTDVSKDLEAAQPWDTNNTKVDFSGRNLTVHLNSESKHYELFGEINEKESFFEFKYENKVLMISMSKNIKKLMWNNWRIEKTFASNAPVYPTSSKTQKNWDQIDKEIEIERKQNKEYDTDGTMHFFKEIFANADPEAQKAMMKSYQTSGGTVLSTNWGDVKDKDYEGKDRPDAPKGQQWADDKK